MAGHHHEHPSQSTSSAAGGQVPASTPGSIARARFVSNPVTGSELVETQQARLLERDEEPGDEDEAHDESHEEQRSDLSSSSAAVGVQGRLGRHDAEVYHQQREPADDDEPADNTKDLCVLMVPVCPERTQNDRAKTARDDEEEDSRLYELGDGTQYNLDELESSSSMLADLFQWNYPIFELADNSGQSILSKLSYRIFFDSGFFDSFKIPRQAFFNFFHALEEGYLDKPYHNRLHAADVLHAVYYLTSQPISNFCQVPLDLIELYDNLLATTKPNSQMLTSAGSASARGLPADTQQTETAAVTVQSEEFISKLHNHIVAIVVAARAAAADSELPFGIMGANLTALEVMALYTAAAMHDFQHPGRTNSFLVATNSPLVSSFGNRKKLFSEIYAN